jgi:hypothetical protein
MTGFEAETTLTAEVSVASLNMDSNSKKVYGTISVKVDGASPADAGNSQGVGNANNQVGVGTSATSLVSNATYQLNGSTVTWSVSAKYVAGGAHGGFGFTPTVSYKGTDLTTSVKWPGR